MNEWSERGKKWGGGRDEILKIEGYRDIQICSEHSYFKQHSISSKTDSSQQPFPKEFAKIYTLHTTDQ